MSAKNIIASPVDIASLRHATGTIAGGLPIPSSAEIKLRVRKKADCDILSPEAKKVEARKIVLELKTLMMRVERLAK